MLSGNNCNRKAAWLTGDRTIYIVLELFDLSLKQAEAEVVASSSLVKIAVEVEVGVCVEVELITNYTRNRLE